MWPEAGGKGAPWGPWAARSAAGADVPVVCLLRIHPAQREERIQLGHPEFDVPLRKPHQVQHDGRGGASSAAPPSRPLSGPCRSSWSTMAAARG